MLKNDVYTVSSVSNYSENDKLIVSMLYQPLLGYTAFSVYNLLWSELNYNKLLNFTQSMISRLTTILSMSVLDIENSLERLSGLGLLENHVKKENGISHYHFKLNKPMKAEAFLNTPVLKNNLYLHLGEDDFNKTCLLFTCRKVNLEGYENISKKYKEVYTQPANNYVNMDKDVKIMDDSRGDVAHDYNFEPLKLALQTRNLEQILSNQLIKNKIQSMDLAYKVTLDQMVDCLVASVKGASIDFDVLEKCVKERHDFNINTASMAKTLYNAKSSDDIYGSQSVQEFVKKQYKHLDVKDEVYRQIHGLMRKYNLRPSLMNILIEFMLAHVGNLSISYMDKVLQSTIRLNNITEDSQMLDYLNDVANKEKASKAKHTPTRGKAVLGTANNQLYQDVETSDEDQIKAVKALIKQNM